MILTVNVEELENRIRQAGKPVEKVIIQEIGGISKAVEKGNELANLMAEEFPPLQPDGLPTRPHHPVHVLPLASTTLSPLQRITSLIGSASATVYGRRLASNLITLSASLKPFSTSPCSMCGKEKAGGRAEYKYPNNIFTSKKPATHIIIFFLLPFF